MTSKGFSRLCFSTRTANTSLDELSIPHRMVVVCLVENVKELLKAHEGITHEVYLDNENSVMLLRF